MNETQDKLFLLRIVKDGRVVADAPLRIYDREIAMEVFLNSFAGLIPSIATGVFQVVRMACGPHGESLQGVAINIEEKVNIPGLVVPQNGQRPRGL